MKHHHGACALGIGRFVLFLTGLLVANIAIADMAPKPAFNTNVWINARKVGVGTAAGKDSRSGSRWPTGF